MTTEPIAVATIKTAGLTITAPAELVIAAGWTLGEDVAIDRTSNGFATRRLYRVLSERGQFPQGQVSAEAARHILARIVELGEIEGNEGRRNNADLAVARLHAEAARDRMIAAKADLQRTELELTARRCTT